MTTEQQAMMEQAAQEGASRCCESEAYGYVVGFPDGASFYEEEIMPGIMAEFAEWLHKNFTKNDVYNKPWYFLKEGRFCETAELVPLFLSHLKQKQDAVI